MNAAAIRRFQGKIALVSGAGSGIGQATAQRLGQEGATVICLDLDSGKAEETERSIRDAGGSAWSALLDVRSEGHWSQIIDLILQRHGRLDVAVNSAGISLAGPVPDFSLESWRRIMAVNLDGVFLGTRSAIQLMRRRPEGGSIVNVSSLSGVKAYANAAAYCASKAGVIIFSRAAALECRSRGENIRINCVSPAGVRTPIWKTMTFFQELVRETGSEEAAFKSLEEADREARWASPEEVASVILYLASDEAACVSGSNLVFD